MPKFDRVPIGEAKTKTDRPDSKRARIIAEYLSYIEQLGAGEAGRLQAAEGEPITTVRRRIGAAGRQLGRKLTIPPTGDEVYFWVERRRAANGRRRRGRGASLTSLAQVAQLRIYSG